VRKWNIGILPNKTPARCPHFHDVDSEKENMPILGLGLHILVALYFAVHAVRHRQQMYWGLILFSFPVLGSVVYFFAIYLPNSRPEHGARQVVAAARSLDPTRELREARANLACGRAGAAIGHLELIVRSDAGLRAEQVALLLAQSYAGAKAAFESALARFGGFECRAEYAVWAAGAGEAETAGHLRLELQRTVQRWSRHTREINIALIRRLNAALGASL
jgi:hypothetical protein